ncbi:MAG: TonB-dependent receptor [Prevotellaceae bacterium]|jgi:TonB-linked SusC/RagA family outer membrane protein|nr:TonB-dependent receptor [Prevotellaceae bacterium]
MKKITLILIGMMLAASALFAQVQVSGVVTDAADGQPLPGVSVVVKGTNVSSATDANGRYTINVAGDATLVFSFIGMKTQEEAVDGRSTINVALEVEAKRLEDVVVVAYGTAKKGTYTGAVAVVGSTEKLKDIPVISFENALQGAAAGVQVGTTSGQPGAQAEIRIRGTGSFNASNSPLYVIDGVPANSGDYTMFSSYGGSLSIMSTINPSDIESITILKDAAATALYGSRGANGVILVTTKKGQQGALKINFKGSWGINNWAINNRPYLGGNQTRMLTLEGAYNQAIYNGLSEADARAYSIVEADKYAPARTEYSDWEGALFRNNGTNNSYEVSANGGNDKLTFYVSLGARDELGMANNSDFKSYTGKANVAYKGDKWQVEANISLAKAEQNYMFGGLSYNNYYAMTRLVYMPNIPIYNPDGSYYEGPLLQGQANLVKDGFLDISRHELFKSTNNLSFAYEFIKGLTLKETLSYDHSVVKGIAVWPSNSNNGKTHNGNTQIQEFTDVRFYSSMLLTYEKIIAADHTVNVLLGWDVDDNPTNYINAAARNYATPNLWEMVTAAEPTRAQSDHDSDRMTSYFSRLNYSYKDKYYVSGAFRRDGSSRLGTNTRWGDFWSVSASWRAKEESFLKYVDFIDDLKLRASYGVSGTLPNSLYSSLATYGYTLDYNGQSGSAPSRLANPDLSWERNFVFDIGLEARFFDRVSLEFDFYNRQTEDMLLDVPVSRTTGFATTLLNYGGMNNRGVELTLAVDILKNNDFFWTSTFILAHNRNKVTKIYNGEEFVSGNFMIREGESVYSYRAREWAGVDPGTGDSMWYIYETDSDGNFTGVKNLTKDPDLATREIQAKADPTLTGGWRNTFEWKGIDFDALFSFSLGGHSWDNGWQMSTDGLYPDQVISAMQLDRWQKPGDEAQFPRRMHGGGHGNYTSSRWIHSTDHLRLKTLTVGYRLPQNWVKKASIQNARVFVAGNNLLTWAAYKDYDPEVPISGETTWSLPALRSVTFGVELTF